MTFSDGTGEVGDLMLSTVNGASPRGLFLFCFLFFSAGSFCSFIRIEERRGSDDFVLDERLEPASESDSVAVEVSDSFE